MESNKSTPMINLENIKQSRQKYIHLLVDPVTFIKSQLKRKRDDDDENDDNEKEDEDESMKSEEIVNEIVNSPVMVQSLLQLQDKELWDIAIRIGYPELIRMCQVNKELEDRICNKNEFWAELISEVWDVESAQKYARIVYDSRSPGLSWRRRFQYFHKVLVKKKDVERAMENDPRITELSLTGLSNNEIQSALTRSKYVKTLIWNNISHGLAYQQNQFVNILLQTDVIEYIEFKDEKEFLSVVNMSVVAKYLEGTKQLKKMKFNNVINDINIQFLTEGLKKNRSIEEIIINFKNFVDDADEVSGVIDGLINHPKLKLIEIANYDVSLDNANSLKNYLQTNTILTDLYLFNNKFSPETIEPIMEGLGQNTTLETLQITDSTGLKNEGMISISSMLSKNTGLEDLILEDCGIEYQGAWILGQGLKQNDTLKSLTLDGNPLSFKGLRVLLETIIEKGTLKGFWSKKSVIELDIIRNREIIAKLLARSNMKNFYFTEKNESDGENEIIIASLLSLVRKYRRELRAN